MRVIVICDDFAPHPGGIAIFVDNLCSQLCRLGHRVDVLTPFTDGALDADSKRPHQVHRYTSQQRLSSLAPVSRTIRLHRRHRYDVTLIGSFMTTHALGALVLRWLWGVPYAILSHGNDLSYSVSKRADKPVARLMLKNASLMLANSRFTAQRIREAGFRGEIAVLNPGVDPARFFPAADVHHTCRQYGLKGRRVLFTSARLVPKKNVAGVLRALAQVVERVPDAIYLVAGDGEERSRLEALCDDLGLRSHVCFLGYIENRHLPALYSASDVFVLPSYGVRGDIETFGISYLEASACGKPVIGGRSGGVMDAVIDGETGILVDPHDVDAIAAAIIRVLGDSELARRLGENGRRHAQELSWDKVALQLEGRLEAMVAGGKM